MEFRILTIVIGLGHDSSRTLFRKKKKWTEADPRENHRTDLISRILAAGSFLDRSPMICQFTLRFPPSSSLLRPSPSRVLSSGMAKGMMVDDASSRTVLSEGFKGTDENSCSFHGAAGKWVKRRGRKGRSLQSIFIIYLRVSSDWLLPDLCPMARANSRAIAHGYLLVST